MSASEDENDGQKNDDDNQINKETHSAEKFTKSHTIEERKRLAQMAMASPDEPSETQDIQQPNAEQIIPYTYNWPQNVWTAKRRRRKRKYWNKGRGRGRGRGHTVWGGRVRKSQRKPYKDWVKQFKKTSKRSKRRKKRSKSSGRWRGW